MGAVGLDAKHMESAAKIGRHGHKAIIRRVQRHAGNVRFLRERNADAVLIGVLAAHTVVPAIEKREHILHGCDAAGHVIHARFEHILLA